MKEVNIRQINDARQMPGEMYFKLGIRRGEEVVEAVLNGEIQNIFNYNVGQYELMKEVDKTGNSVFTLVLRPTFF
ncbi:MAG: hypothetical protein Q7R49_00270 [Candidatus Daviesbacteria bacterium]|nr:hypothetical protein [Candidatus Daviesbacteria bacterium]